MGRWSKLNGETPLSFLSVPNILQCLLAPLLVQSINTDANLISLYKGLSLLVMTLLKDKAQMGSITTDFSVINHHNVVVVKLLTTIWGSVNQLSM